MLSYACIITVSRMTMDETSSVSLVNIFLATPHTFLLLFSSTLFFIASILELQHQLMTFGLPTEDTNFPLTTGGKIKRKNLNDWIQYRRNVDELLRRNGYVPQTVVGCPSPKDVLFSMKHKRDKRQLGNQELRRLIERDYDAFHSAPARSEQRDIIIRNVIEEIVTQWKGRFLVWNDEMLWWDELVLPSSSTAPLPSPSTGGGGPGASPSLPSSQSTITRTSTNQELETKIRKKFNSTGPHRGDTM